MRHQIKIGHNRPPKKKAPKREIKKPKRQSPKLLKEFIFKMHPLEQMVWKKVAGPSGAKIYQFIKWKRGMMKYNGWITVGNVEMRNHGWPMNRETKSNAIYKLNQAQLIGIHPQEPGKSVRVFRPDIKGEYDDR
tara:strand:- start:404 stop:805 length:402 start_codon:yes stop_codon:yes gene_type:complete